MLRILIVDDSQFFREQLKDILHELGYERISEAPDGRVALRKLLREIYDLVFLDWLMPNVNGIQFLNAVRRNQVICDVPIVMMTCQAEQHNIMEAVKAGANSYMVKPIDKESIRNKLIELGFIKND
ncbi:MAG: response regulator [Nitrospinae bacterium]|nr:response regulator [Nitrospinota bacterium]